jgi:hypothetical protein
VTDAQYDVADRGWRAFRSATPEALDAFRREDSPALPFLSSALTRFLQDYPWTVDGLSRTERRFLQLAQPGPMTLLDVFLAIDKGQREYYVTDLSLLDLVHELSHTSPPLASFAASETPGARTFRGTVTTTDAGREVLAGTRDRVTSCGGFDRWMGGVHLRSGHTMWRWDDQQQRVIASADSEES